MILFSFPEQAILGKAMGLEQGAWEWRHFPDGESYVRVDSHVKGKTVAILCSLNQPDIKTLPLIFLTRTLKEMGAARITLIAPYLGYMRQDKRFKEGEAVTSDIFAALLSPYIDALITIDPHLHRRPCALDCSCYRIGKDIGDGPRWHEPLALAALGSTAAGKG
jgi:ribose-phosphate pyrophosphokinase